jgi:hypothetical protein
VIRICITDVDAPVFRLTNAFSKKVETHAASVILYFMYFNFGRVHQTLRVTPAMEAGVANHVWSIESRASILPCVMMTCSMTKGPFDVSND